MPRQVIPRLSSSSLSSLSRIDRIEGASVHIRSLADAGDIMGNRFVSGSISMDAALVLEESGASQRSQ
jgi:hypothetical protein